MKTLLFFLFLATLATYACASKHPKGSDDDVDFGEDSISSLLRNEILNSDEENEDNDDNEIEDNEDFEDEELLQKNIMQKDPFLFSGRRRRRRRCASPAKKKCHVETNGCGSGIFTKIPYTYKKLLTPACHKHDVCYSCGKKYGWSQKPCDVRFKSDMYRLCRCKLTGWRVVLLPNCYKRALQMYSIVRLLGKNFYNNVASDWCKSCVIPYGSPNYTV
ncbi:uncharacterized protein [Clytia hemisphaerica]|uniref:Cnidarian restricted protein n=1 Tax=Clytia hemisphaerica TaxID=252671 RepID=A0A7M5XM69_9CNID|eukprot:TCONS_00050496-protein